MQKNSDELKKIVSRYSDLLKSFDSSTQKMLDYATEGNLEKCDWESQNRDRLVKIIRQEYLEIKKRFGEKLDSHWEQEFQLFVKKNVQRDEEILEMLKGQRIELQETIASVYRIRKNIQGYSPHNI